MFFDLTESYELAEADVRRLTIAAEHLTEAYALAAVVEEHGRMISGSSGQLVLNPAVTEARHHRIAADGILKAVFADSGEGGYDVDAASLSPRARQNKAAADKRWTRAGNAAAAAVAAEAG